MSETSTGAATDAVIDGTCSALSAVLGEPPAATAAVTTGWLLLEHPGPWGAKALTGSRGIDPVVGAELDRRAAEAGLRACLIRRPGRDAEVREGGLVTAYVAWTVPGATRLRRLRVAGAAGLLDLDLASPTLGEACAEPIVLVCANGKRDRCCATEGRPLAAALAAALPRGRVWEATHLGGHRFAPTAVVLPDGYSYARLDTTAGLEVLAAADAGRMVQAGCRGRSTWERPAQAAELFVRGETGETGADAVRPGVAEVVGADAWRVRVEHVDGRSWVVDVVAEADATPRPESCGKPAVVPHVMRAAWAQG